MKMAPMRLCSAIMDQNFANAGTKKVSCDRQFVIRPAMVDTIRVLTLPSSHTTTIRCAHDTTEEKLEEVFLHDRSREGSQIGP